MRALALLSHTPITPHSSFILYSLIIMWYFVRLTSDKLNKESLAQLVGEPYLIAKEYSQRMKLHAHCIFQSELSKDEVKTLFYNAYPDEPKGPATLQVDLIGDTMEDWKQASTYTVKDGDYIYSDYFEEYIKSFVENSFKKNQTYTTMLKQLIEDVTHDDYHRINWRQLKVQIAILRSEYHLEIYKVRIEALVLSIQVSMNHNKALDLFSC